MAGYKVSIQNSAALIYTNDEMSEKESLKKYLLKSCQKMKYLWDFTGGPVVKILPSQCRGQGSIPGQETRSHMPQHAMTKQLRSVTAN